MRGVIRQIFEDHLPAVLAKRDLHDLSEREWRGAWCMATCRTAAQGTHALVCPDGHGPVKEAFNSCRHRGCVQCGWPATQRWIERREAQVLHGAHVHTIWTMPDVFDPLWLYNRKTYTELLFRACWETVHTLMADPRWCGGRPGMLAVFQSWGDYTQRHPHLHAIVTAGGMDDDGNWQEPKHSFVICARVAMELFRGKMRAFIIDGLSTGALVCPPDTNTVYWTREADKQGLRKWNVHVQPPYAETGRVIRYLGAYLKRGPLSEKRVTSYDGHTVRIAHRHPEEHEADYYELAGEECVRRLLLHMPEPRLHTSRSYGLYHPAAQKLLATARAQIRLSPVPDDSTAEAPRQPVSRVPSTPPPVCPECGRPLRVCVRIHGGQSPPASYRQQQRRRAA
jgi:hypothetical protein